MDLNETTQSFEGTSEASELRNDSEMNNSECNFADSNPVVDGTKNPQNTTPQTKTLSNDLEKQNGNCKIDTQNFKSSVDLNDTNQSPEGIRKGSEPHNDSEMNNSECNPADNSCNRTTDPQNTPPETETPSGDSEKQNGYCKADIKNSDSPQDDLLESVRNNLNNSNKSEVESEMIASNKLLSEAIIKISKPLCADYRSDSDSDSVDSDSDSSLSSTDTTTETSSESEDDSDDSFNSNKNKSKQDDKKSKRELTLLDLPPIEDLVISLPEDSCVEVGTISGIVDTLVVIESYKGSAALDVDTVLFLDSGKRTLGKVFDILGPITEPVYTVRFNSQEQIKNLGIEKGLKVFYAPKTQHTNFVFMSEVLKNRGSDASWKDNTEAPPEFQDFSDDEEERLHKQKHMKEPEGENSRDQNKSRKRPFAQFKQNRAMQPNSFRNPNFSPQRRPNFQRFPPNNQFTPPNNQFTQPNAFPRPNFSNPFNYNATPYRGPAPPQMYLPPQISGAPFPGFGGLLSHNQYFQQPYYQQRSHPQNFGGWGNLMMRPPPPPPPATEQSNQHPAFDKPS